MSAWLDTVKKTFKDGRSKDPNYKFKNALKDAKKFYNKGKEVVVDAAVKTRKGIKKGVKRVSKKIRKMSKKMRKKQHKKSYKHKKKVGGDAHDEYCSSLHGSGTPGYNRCMDSGY